MEETVKTLQKYKENNTNLSWSPLLTCKPNINVLHAIENLLFGFKIQLEGQTLSFQQNMSQAGMAYVTGWLVDFMGCCYVHAVTAVERSSLLRKCRYVVC